MGSHLTTIFWNVVVQTDTQDSLLKENKYRYVERKIFLKCLRTP